jgi:methylase of polypeptide subunit release factors
MIDTSIVDREVLTNGLVRLYHPRTDGGGEWMRWFLAQQIREHGLREKYNTCYEWCSGSSPMGFHMYDQGLADNLVLVDKYDLAITDCHLTIEENNLQDNVVAYCHDRVQDIPQGEPWDLVIANPPHSFRSEHASGGTTEEADEYLTRVLLDDKMVAHQEFFDNIASRLSDGAEMFIIQHCTNFAEQYPDMISDVGLKYLGQHIFDIMHGPLPPGVSHREDLPNGCRENLANNQWATMHFVKGE